MTYDDWRSTHPDEVGQRLVPHRPQTEAWVTQEQLEAQAAICVVCERPILSLRDNGLPQTCAACLAKEERGDAWEAGDEG